MIYDLPPWVVSGVRWDPFDGGRHEKLHVFMRGAPLPEVKLGGSKKSDIRTPEVDRQIAKRNYEVPGRITLKVTPGTPFSCRITKSRTEYLIEWDDGRDSLKFRFDLNLNALGGLHCVWNGHDCADSEVLLTESHLSQRSYVRAALEAAIPHF